MKRVTTSAKATVERPGKNVRQKAGLNRDVLEVSPGMMISMLRYKAERAAALFAVIDARMTSQQYSQCGRTVSEAGPRFANLSAKLGALRRQRFRTEFSPGLAGPAAHETLLFYGVVGTEVGFVLVRLSPRWQRQQEEFAARPEQVSFLLDTNKTGVLYAKIFHPAGGACDFEPHQLRLQFDPDQ